MQDKGLGILVFVVVAVLLGFLGFSGEGSYDFMGGVKGALSDPGTWATVITALAVAAMAMGVWTNGGLSGVDIKQTVLLLVVAALVGGTFPGGDWGAALALAWILTGGLRV